MFEVDTFLWRVRWIAKQPANVHSPVVDFCYWFQINIPVNLFLHTLYKTCRIWLLLGVEEIADVKQQGTKAGQKNEENNEDNRFQIIGSMLLQNGALPTFWLLTFGQEQSLQQNSKNQIRKYHRYVWTSELVKRRLGEASKLQPTCQQTIF